MSDKTYFVKLKMTLSYPASVYSESRIMSEKDLELLRKSPFTAKNPNYEREKTHYDLEMQKFNNFRKILEERNLLGSATIPDDLKPFPEYPYGIEPKKRIRQRYLPDLNSFPKQVREAETFEELITHGFVKIKELTDNEVTLIRELNLMEPGRYNLLTFS